MNESDLGYSVKLQRMIENLQYEDTPPPYKHLYHHAIVEKAKAQTKKYKDALESIAVNTCCETCQEARLVAIAALKKDSEA
jgi:hypothetical protein